MNISKGSGEKLKMVMIRKIALWLIVLAVITLAVIFRDDMKETQLKHNKSNITSSISIGTPSPYRVDKSMGNNRYERKLISLYNDVVDYVMLITETVKEGGNLGSEEEYEIYRLGILFSDYAEENMKHIRYSVFQDIMERNEKLLKSLSNLYPKPQYPYEDNIIIQEAEAPLVIQR